MEDDDIEIPKPGPNRELIRAVLAGDVELFNLSSAMDFSETQEGFAYWEAIVRDGLDEAARLRLALIADPG